jgi:hypothetical protein
MPAPVTGGVGTATRIGTAATDPSRPSETTLYVTSEPIGAEPST